MVVEEALVERDEVGVAALDLVLEGGVWLFYV